MSDATEAAIEALYEVAIDNSRWEPLTGFLYPGDVERMATLDQRVEAARALGSYVPHPKAVKALSEIIARGAPKAVLVAATKALGNRK